MNPQDTGAHGEALAADYLTRKGYRVLEQGYRFQHTEIDLICRHPASASHPVDELVFVEVKTRKRSGMILPEAAVTPQKQKHLIRAARAYLRETDQHDQWCRFDVIGIILRHPTPEIRHFENAFTA